MIRLRLTVVLLIAALGLGVMGGVLLAQQPEATDTPAPFDCSPEGLSNLTKMIDELYPPDPSADLDTFTNNLYRGSLLNQQLALECGHQSTPDDNQNSRDTLQKLVNQLAVIQALRVGIDPIKAMGQMEDLTGDPLRGEDIFNAYERTALNLRLGCVGCHIQGTTAPATEDLWDSDALKQPEFADYTAAQYAVESILQPDAYLVPSYDDTMPHEYGLRMAAQDLADIVAYLHVASADYRGPDSMDAAGANPKD